MTEKANEAPFGSATIMILSGRRPAVPEANQNDMVVLTIRVQDLTEVNDIIGESQGWSTANLVNRQILFHE